MSAPLGAVMWYALMVRRLVLVLVDTARSRSSCSSCRPSCHRSCRLSGYCPIVR